RSSGVPSIRAALASCDRATSACDSVGPFRGWRDTCPAAGRRSLGTKSENQRPNAYVPRGSARPRMALIERANPTDRADVERLIAAYHTSEGVKPKPERISWAVEQQMKNRFPGVLLVA